MNNDLRKITAQIEELKSQKKNIELKLLELEGTDVVLCSYQIPMAYSYNSDVSYNSVELPCKAKKLKRILLDRVYDVDLRIAELCADYTEMARNEQ